MKLLEFLYGWVIKLSVPRLPEVGQEAQRSIFSWTTNDPKVKGQQALRI